MEPWCPIVPWYHHTMVPWCHGAMVLNTESSMTTPQSSTISHQSSVINHPSSVLNHQSSVINHQAPAISHQASIINHQSSIIKHQSSIISYQSPITKYQSAITSHHGSKSWPRCCLVDLGFRIKISAYPLGRSTSFFEPDLFRLLPGCGGWAEVRPIGAAVAPGWGRAGVIRRGYGFFPAPAAVPASMFIVIYSIW